MSDRGRSQPDAGGADTGGGGSGGESGTRGDGAGGGDGGFADGEDEPPADVLGRVEDGVVAIDRDWVVTYANDRARSLLDVDTLRGRELLAAAPWLSGTALVAQVRAALDGEGPLVVEATGPEGRDGLTGRVHGDADGATLLLHARGRGRGERSFPWLVYRCTYEEGWPTEVNGGGVEAISGYPASAFSDGDVSWVDDVIHPADRDRVVSAIEAGVAGDGSYTATYRVRRSDGEVRWVWDRGRGAPGREGPPEYLEGVVVDVERWGGRADELRREHDLLARVLDASPVGILEMSATGHVLRANERAEELLGEHGGLTGLHFGERTLEGPDAGELDVLDLVEEALASGEPVVDRTVSPDGASQSHLSVNVVPLYDEGTLDGAVVVLEDVSGQREREEMLRAQRDELETLNRINAVIREVDQVLVEADTRADLERGVCERLVTDETFTFAWVGEYDLGDRTVHVRDAAGDDQGFLVQTSIDVDGDEYGEGPVERAVRRREVAAVQDVAADGRDGEDWRDAALERGFRSMAAIPVSYESTLYGVLCVYADREGAFDGREQRVLAGLGENMGHAINALERKHTLLTGGTLELEFRLNDTANPLLDLTAETGGRIEVHRTIPVDADTTVQYVGLTGIAADRFEAAMDDLTNVRSYRRLPGHERPVYEVRNQLAAIQETLAEYGGRIRNAVIEDGEYRVTTELSDGVDVRTVANAVEGVNESAELAAQRTLADADRPPRVTQSLIEERLTDRQRDVLETAYFAGFFEQPRASTGEEVADTLDVSSPTFSQHLRAAERKVFGALFEHDQ